MAESAEGYFPETVAGALAGKRPRFAYLVEFAFEPEAKLFWNGNRTLVTLDDREWVGARQLAQIDGLEDALNGESSQVTVTMSGAVLSSDIMQAAASESREDYMWKLQRVWLQFFDNDWQPIDHPYAIHGDLITGLELMRAPAGSNGWVRQLQVQSVNMFYGRSAAPRGYYTDADQQARYPGDLGMQFIAGLQDSVISIPW